jgi:hypothetical protein
MIPDQIPNRIYKISEIKKVDFTDDEDSFGGRNRYVTIRFANGRAFILQGFSKKDLEDIIARIRSVTPNAIDPSIDRFLQSPPTQMHGSWRQSLRPGDTFIFVGGLIFVLICIAWWVSHIT